VTEVLAAVFIGHVDHGKSTLIARLMLDAGAFPEGRLKELEEASKRRGVPVEISFLLDAFQVERDQAVTIDSTRVWLRMPARTYAIIDAPGHKEFVRHMVGGASEASVAVLLIDALEGISEQTRRHLLLLWTLNISQVVVVINKMDLADFSSSRFESIASDAKDLLASMGLTCCGTVPAVARDGDNIVRASARMPWYEGPSLLELLAGLPPSLPTSGPLRFPIQDVYRRGSLRTLVGNVEGSGLKSGTNLVVLPAGNAAVVQRVVRFPENTAPARDGEAIGIVLDRPLFAEAGDVACAPEQSPHVTSQFGATIFWLSTHPLSAGDRLCVRVGTRDAIATLAIERKINVETLAFESADSLRDGDIAQVRLIAEAPIVVERTTGSVLSRVGLYRNGILCGGGTVTGVSDGVQERLKSSNVELESHLVSVGARQRRQGHRSGVVWLTGLPSAGKSTLGRRLEAKLYALGWNAYFLDGDTLRTGLNGDLGFSAEARRENVRRAGEVAALFADGGFLSIAALVSPNQTDRARARAACKAGDFIEVYIRAPLKTCEERDPKGLYKRARAGEIPDFTGISAPYEPPDRPELVVDTAERSIDECVEQLLAFVRSHYAGVTQSSPAQNE